MNLKILFLFLLIVSCSTPVDSKRSLVLNDTLTIHYQETLSNSNENISLSFDSLYENRCPMNVICIREGEARILFNFSSANKSSDFWLEKCGLLGNQSTDDTIVYNYKITLVNALPYPHTDSSYTPDDYSAEIIVSE